MFHAPLSAQSQEKPPSCAVSPAVQECGDSSDQRITELSRKVEALTDLVRQLQAQIDANKAAPVQKATSAESPPQPMPPSATPTEPVVPQPILHPSSLTESLLASFTVNALLDGYYEYNTNAPIGRANYLRAFDVSSNSFSLNQAAVVFESAPDVAAGKRAGLRLDFQYGQATATLQGSSANELRPDVYRAVFQAYGTYIFPIGKGLTVDFGKWASSLGIEGNYTKDQLNYSRSFWFDYLPFYHMGVRAKYAVSDELALNLWISNGTQQTEAFNNYKDQLFGIVLTPTPQITWTLNYYQGQEHPDVEYFSAAPAGQTSVPTQQGTYFLPISNPHEGKLQIVDSYVSWQVSKALYLAAEADYVQQRLDSFSSPNRVTGGAVYGGYQLSSTWAIAARAEYLADVGGLYSGTTQYIKEGTFTVDYRPVDGFLMRAEYRRDQSNQHYFLSNKLGVLESMQPTIGLGLVWWFGQKNGLW